jgi:hypothetical protein
MAHKTARENAIQAVQSAPDGFSVTISEPNRTLEQNAAQWPILEAFADQLQWPVNGQMVWMTPEEWKDVLTAAFKRETARIAMGLDGGVVMLGMRTSKMGKKQFSEWIDFIKATAALRDVDIDYMDHA